MTKTYLGYGYTNNRGVAKLEYTPNNEKLTTTGYKNTHTNNTQITAQITHKNKTYTSNTKQYNGITLPTDDPNDYIFYDDQTTNKTNQYQCKYNSPLQYVQNEYIKVGGEDATQYVTPITIQNNDHWIFEAETLNAEDITSLGISLMNVGSVTIRLTWTYEDSKLRLSSNIRCSSSKLNESPANILSTNKWYKFKWEINNGQLISSCYNDNTLIYSTTITLPDLYNTSLYFGVYGANNTKFRNIKIKKVED